MGYVLFGGKNTFFVNTIEKLKSSNLIEGNIQLGSGGIGYKDEHSDIDLMVSTYRVEDVKITKNLILRSLSDFNPIYIKKKHSENVYLIIALMEKNRLEFNVSIVPRELFKGKIAFMESDCR